MKTRKRMSQTADETTARATDKSIVEQSGGHSSETRH